MRLPKAVLASFASAVAAIAVFSPTVFAASGASLCSKTFLGFPTWFKYLPMTSPPSCEIVTTNLGGDVFILVLMAIIEILLTLGGIIAIGFVIFGAFKFITSQGDPQKVAGARTTIANALVGLVIALVASRVVAYIAGRLSKSAVTTATNGVIGSTNIPQAAANSAQLQDLLSFIFILAGAISVLVITVAGFNFVISQGDPQKVAKARQTILYAIVGLSISVFAFVIVRFVITNV